MQHRYHPNLVVSILALSLAVSGAILVGCSPAVPEATPTRENVSPPVSPPEVLDFRQFFPAVPARLGKLANHLVFFSDRAGKYQLFQIALDGSGLLQLTNNPDLDAYKMEPDWSPDGRIAFASNHVDRTWEIFILYPDRPLPVQLTDWKYDAWSLAWSPDGKSLAFVSNATGDDEIYVIPADGGTPLNLTNRPDASDHLPVWSPDGKQILFVSERFTEETHDLYVMASDGSGETRLTEAEGRDTSPDWSPDGKKIAFISEREGNFEIYVMDVPSGTGSSVSELLRLTSTAGYEWSPTWSPDGQWIAFTSLRDGGENYEVYVMSADGSNQTRLTDDPADDIIPRWWP